MKATARELAGLAALVLTVGALGQWWVAHRQATLGAQVAALAQAGDIRMLASDSCSICVVARRWFAEHDVAFQECSIERDAACQADFRATQSPGTPVLLVRGQALVGFSPERVRAALGSTVP